MGKEGKHKWKYNEKTLQIYIGIGDSRQNDQPLVRNRSYTLVFGRSVQFAQPLTLNQRAQVLIPTSAPSTRTETGTMED